jgi:hypothetical protein
MDHLFEISDFDRHNLKRTWPFTRAILKKAEPKPAAPKPETSLKSEPAA